ncbi:hypothetical protein BX616_005260 [Lobosporangium transversale]|uniref:NAD(P)-binding protein n=1 Tax=Lobosporangium transversale TaxID=64571 RepID=A0A1Y2GI07_9FUNG|nr:hypothetical protein BCR41DRAFT_357165 [Lobosporangium transversale]KAF9897626.1 hypothetical protein BX616_005260 [Lobosporangium transversale]ORZ11408.1 hypothetical protein BCR41DRAFT_357165 [Lobosporangium transversale]|eukprot:XP_021879723.1 hypothetical protein BCR41DRAFT_357165 [Lobosporangium transversale]
MIPERKVAIVTGANTGVGYAIVQRLVEESPNPLTVILACRNKGRAMEAKLSLEVHFATLLQKRRQIQEEYNKGSEKNNKRIEKENGTTKGSSRGTEFQKTAIDMDPKVEISLVDVGSVNSVLEFNQRILQQYPRIDYLFCNAGILPSDGIIWSKALIETFTAPMNLVVRSDVLRQPKQHLTQDGIGNVLACNVFGHYVMIKGLESALNNTPEDPGRVIWTSSLTAEKANFDINDWQGLKAEQPYESSKWVTDMLAIRLNEMWGQQPAGTSSDVSSTTDSTTVTKRMTRSASKATHAEELKDNMNPSPTTTAVGPSERKNIISITTQPGVVASGIGGLAAWITMIRIALHLMVRLMGESHQTVTNYHGAYANVYVALKPVEEINYRNKYGSGVTRLGYERLKVEKVVEYDETQAEFVVDKMEKLRLSFTSSR